MEGELTSADYRKLQSLVDEQEKAAQAGNGILCCVFTDCMCSIWFVCQMCAVKLHMHKPAWACDVTSCHPLVHHACCNLNAVLRVGKETPNNLRMKVSLSIGSTALRLLGSDSSAELLKAGLDNLETTVHMYPETLEVLAAVQVCINIVLLDFAVFKCVIAR